MKVLFIGAGKRVTIASFFKQEGFEVHSYEYDVYSPINLVCTKIIPGLKWDDDEISDHLTKIINDYDLVIPFQDAATKLLSSIKNDHNKMKICVSDFVTTDLCLDKQKFEKFFLSNKEINCYYPFPDKSTNIVIKPRFGFSSKEILFKDHLEQSDFNDLNVIQKRIYGDEYSIDCMFDIESKLIDFVPRKRIQVVGGEVIKSVTVDKNFLSFNEIIPKIANNFNFVGPVCMQFIVDEFKNVFIMEINARFGGGATLSIASGFNVISLIKDIFINKNFDINHYQSTWKSNFYMSRAYQDFYYEKNSI